MKQFIWSDALVSEYTGFWGIKKAVYGFDAQKAIDAFKAKVLARNEPVKEGVFEGMANILRPTPLTELDKFTSNIEGETEEERDNRLTNKMIGGGGK